MVREQNAFIQRTKDGYFNATTLLNHWNNENIKTKQLGNYKKNESTKEFIELLKQEGISKPILAGRGSGENVGSWMHPKLFIDFAMWISVEFKSKVIDYVLDGLIISRHSAGDHYKQMCRAIMDVYIDYYNKKPPAKIFIEEANMIKSLVVEKGRNEMSENELRQVTYLQKVNENLIRKYIGKDARIKRLTEAAEITV